MLQASSSSILVGPGGHTQFQHSLLQAIRYLKKTKSQELLLRSSALICIYLLAFSIRLVGRALKACSGVAFTDLGLPGPDLR